MHTLTPSDNSDRHLRSVIFEFLWANILKNKKGSVKGTDVKTNVGKKNELDDGEGSNKKEAKGHRDTNTGGEAVESVKLLVLPKERVLGNLL